MMDGDGEIYTEGNRVIRKGENVGRENSSVDA